VKQGMIQLNLMLTVQKNIKEGFNTIMTRIAKGVNLEVMNSQNAIITELGQEMLKEDMMKPKCRKGIIRI
jgi:hypothetical protein